MQLLCNANDYLPQVNLYNYFVWLAGGYLNQTFYCLGFFPQNLDPANFDRVYVYASVSKLTKSFGNNESVTI